MENNKHTQEIINNHDDPWNRQHSQEFIPLQISAVLMIVY